eukprot:GHVU01230715.1.p3 GENE.GHVU01230715.1~~GHVU01230715.1.p3  ORF type:complete len:105 (+),score=8.81 GHVU01230715.1:786-1100(+)
MLSTESLQTHTHTHTHTYTHTQVHTHTHTRARRHTHPQAHNDPGERLGTNSPAFVLTHVHAHSPRRACKADESAAAGEREHSHGVGVEGRRETEEDEGGSREEA